MSHQLLDLSRKVFGAGTHAFAGPLPTPFERVGLRFTPSRGAALVEFSLDGVPVTNSAYLPGEDSVADRELLGKFVEGLRLVPLFRQGQTTLQPFAEVLGISERPLLFEVVWGTECPQQDQEMLWISRLTSQQRFSVGKMPPNAV